MVLGNFGLRGLAALGEFLWRDLPLFPPDGVYTYAPGRGHEQGHTVLGGYRGILQVDGYAVYKKLVDPSGKQDRARWRFAGRMSDAAFTTWPRVRRRRSRPRRWHGSLHCSSRRRSAASASPNGLSIARPAVPRSLLISALGSRCSIRSCSPAARPPMPLAMR